MTVCLKARTSRLQSPTTTNICCYRWRSSSPRSLCWRNAVKISILTNTHTQKIFFHSHTQSPTQTQSFHYLLFFRNKIRKGKLKNYLSPTSHQSHTLFHLSKSSISCLFCWRGTLSDVILCFLNLCHFSSRWLTSERRRECRNNYHQICANYFHLNWLWAPFGNQALKV